MCQDIVLQDKSALEYQASTVVSCRISVTSLPFGGWWSIHFSITHVFCLRGVYHIMDVGLRSAVCVMIMMHLSISIYL